MAAASWRIGRSSCSGQGWPPRPGLFLHPRSELRPHPESARPSALGRRRGAGRSNPQLRCRKGQ
eukprot:7475481-Pyramimonas_sp.AAC.1